MKYKPTDGKFAGQLGYGYRSFNVFIDAVSAVNARSAHVKDFDHSLASIATTYRTTAILEAGRLSLDNSKSVIIHYGDSQDTCLPTDLAVLI
jgi:D-galacturonate reductase